jgi:hypothetical protein
VSPQRPPFAARPVLLLAMLKLGLHLAANAVTPYGFHRDELLYFAMGRHLRLWRMDFPPGIAMVSEAVRATLGDSLSALRLAPALCGSLLLIAAALAARALGGGRRAQILAALGVLANPLFLRSSNLFQPVVLDQLAWTAALYALIELCGSGARRWWAALGIALGLGLLAKFSAAILGLALLLGLVSPARRSWLRTPWPWLAASLALALGSPGLVGQIRLDFPVIHQLSDLSASQLERVTPLGFLTGQLRWGPATLIGLAGLLGLLLDPRLRPYRVVGWTCLWAFALLLALHGKPYYIGPVYPTLIGAGAVMLERAPDARVGRLLRGGLAALLVLYAAVLLPVGLPVLAPPRMAAYARAIGATEALRTNTGRVERLPQDYADMLGWEAQVRAVAGAYRSLPSSDRDRAVLLAGNYGEAGALEFFGPRFGLPPVVSPTGSFWFFGPGTRPGEVVITIGIGAAHLVPAFTSVQAAGRVLSPWSVEEERELTVYVARGPRRTLQEIWPALAGRN